MRDDLDKSVEQGAETVQYFAAEVYAHQQVRTVYVQRYHDGALDRDVPANFIDFEEEARQFADFAL
ncbi:hypothetical protein [Haladaptatus salinisoli]|uniref:hypothetical protein n=1 Tax=Haladaptatus salinisoli TaxID=2884876 RepID=UPI001D0A8B6E|nr:hypothetical protein [Haladaptatus salinisoli]